MGSPAPRPGTRALVGRIGLLAGTTLALLLGTEIATRALFQWPNLWVQRVPAPIEQLLRAYHTAFLGGGPIQYRPACYEYDPELLYRLKVGECRFDTDEFETKVRVSGRHLREDGETADPEILVLGDSFSLGWGVEREEAYPALLARRLGVREVVVASSSYGTVRELLMLRRLSLEDFDVVVLQYAQNDALENRSFLRRARHVPSPRMEYEATVGLWKGVGEQSFFPRTRHWLSLLRASARPGAPAEPWPGPAEQAHDLLDVLGAFSAELRGRPILVFAADMGGEGPEFLRLLVDAPKAAGLGPLVALDAAGQIGESDRFLFDEHWRPGGHAKVASALATDLLATFPDLSRSSGEGRPRSAGDQRR